VALGLRLAVVVAHPIQPVSDFQIYHGLAATLARDGTYSDVFWPPGWPMLLGGFYTVFGVHPQLGAAFGVLLECGAIAIAAVVAFRLLRPRFALAAVAAMCLYPGSIGYSSVLGTEHLAALLFTALVAVIAFNAPSVRTGLVAGLLGGALLLVRGDYGTAMALIALVWLVRGVPRRRVPVVAAAMLAGALVFVGPWTVRNAVRFGEVIPAATNGGVNFYLGTQGVDYSEPPNIDEASPKARDNRFWRLGFDAVADDPVAWVRRDLTRLRRQYWGESLLLSWGQVSPSELRQVYRAGRWYWRVVVAFAAVGLGAVALGWRRPPPAWVVIAASLVAVTLLKALFIGSERDRLPLTYLLMVVAGFGAQEAVSRLRDVRGARRG
jgi:hypothetical protein